jgi:hypothetical protein
MSKFKAIKLPFHRLHLLDFWGSKADPKLHEANSLTAKVVLCKLWKQNLEPGEKVLPSIEADADQAMVRIREAIEQSDTSLLGALFEAAKETRGSWSKTVCDRISSERLSWRSATLL